MNSPEEDREIDELIAQAREILQVPEAHPFRPVIMLRLVVALAQRVRALEEDRWGQGTGPVTTSSE